MPEWLNGAVSKTVVAFTGYRGFESLSLRRKDSKVKKTFGSFILDGATINTDDG